MKKLIDRQRRPSQNDSVKQYPTKTELLLYGPNGASDPRNPFRLERDLISPSLWAGLYEQMPAKCKDVIDNPDGCSIGIGRNKEVGWFILATGQGPFVIWIESEK